MNLFPDDTPQPGRDQPVNNSRPRQDPRSPASLQEPDFIFDTSDLTPAEINWISNEIPEPYVVPEHIFRVNLFHLDVQKRIRNRFKTDPH